MDLFENSLNGNNKYERPLQQNQTIITIPELEMEIDRPGNDGGENSHEGEIDMSILSTDVIEVNDSLFSVRIHWPGI